MQMNDTSINRHILLEFGALAYAIGIAALAVVHIPLMRYGALPLVGIALVMLGYIMFLLSRPATLHASLLQGVALVSLFMLGGVLYTFGAEFAHYKGLKLHHALTAADRAAHIGAVWKFVAYQSALAVLFVAALWAHTRIGVRALVPLFGLAWISLPLLYLLTQLFERLFPLLEHGSTFILFLLWLAVTAGVGYGSYRITEGKKAYTAVLTLVAFVLPPVGAAAFILFLFVRGLMLLKQTQASG